MSTHDELAATITKLTAPGKGILAADESMPTITKRFTGVGIESTDETRRAYRNLLFTAPDADRYLAGVILFEETLDQKGDDGTPLPDVLVRRGIVPGIKVNPYGTVVIGFNAIVPLNQSGLRTDFTPNGTLEVSTVF